MLEQCLFSEEPPCTLWSCPPKALVLNNDEIHIWRASLETMSLQVKTLEQILSADELSRARRFHFQKDRNHFIVARGLLRTILGRYLTMKPEELRFCCGPYGKPELAEETGGKLLRFNVSHSHDLALYAVTRERNIGVDLEYIRSDLALEDIIEQFLSRREIAVLKAYPEHIRQETFFTWWSRKEACVKAQGTGLADLNKVDLPGASGGPEASCKTAKDAHKAILWSLRDINVGRGYTAALAVEGRNPDLQCWQWEND